MAIGKILIQSNVVSLIEDWKKVVDNKDFEVTVSMDLSKTFGTIHHNHLVAKLHTYGFSSFLVT